MKNGSNTSSNLVNIGKINTNEIKPIMSLIIF